MKDISEYSADTSIYELSTHLYERIINRKIVSFSELKKYISGLDSKQENIFVDCFKQYRWDKIREKLGLSDFKFHDLRKTFGSMLAQNGISTAVTQKLLEHSSPDLTNKVYTNVVYVCYDQYINYDL